MTRPHNRWCRACPSVDCGWILHCCRMAISSSYDHWKYKESEIFWLLFKKFLSCPITLVLVHPVSLFIRFLEPAPKEDPSTNAPLSICINKDSDTSFSFTISIGFPTHLLVIVVVRFTLSFSVASLTNSLAEYFTVSWSAVITPLDFCIWSPRVSRSSGTMSFGAEVIWHLSSWAINLVSWKYRRINILCFT